MKKFYIQPSAKVVKIYASILMGSKDPEIKLKEDEEWDGAASMTRKKTNPIWGEDPKTQPW